jgi:hypothetical protein
LKHTTAWKPTQATKNTPPGWTSPTGRHYQSEQQNWEPPHWPNNAMHEIQHKEQGWEPPQWPPHILNQWQDHEQGHAARGISCLEPEPAAPE